MRLTDTLFSIQAGAEDARSRTGRWPLAAGNDWRGHELDEAPHGGGPSRSYGVFSKSYWSAAVPGRCKVQTPSRLKSSETAGHTPLQRPRTAALRVLKTRHRRSLAWQSRPDRSSKPGILPKNERLTFPDAESRKLYSVPPLSLSMRVKFIRQSNMLKKTVENQVTGNNNGIMMLDKSRFNFQK